MDGPFIAVRFAVDYGMGLSIDGDLKDPNNRFNNNPTLDATYHDPIAYAKNLIARAEALQNDNKYYKPEGWNPIESGVHYANTVFGIIKQIPCNRGDDTSNNLFDSWVAGTGQNFGGHPSNTVTVSAPVTGGTEATGSSAAPESPILGGGQ